jgi:peroxin-3
MTVKTILLWTAGATAGAWALGKWAASTIAALTIEMDEQRTARANVKRRFLQNQADCAFTVSCLLPTLSANVRMDAPTVEDLVARLQEAGQVVYFDILQQTLSPEDKIALWEEIKMKSFSRAFNCAYMLALIVLFTHTQLNLLGRFIYLDSVPGIAEDGKTSLDRETERKFLVFSWYLLNKSWMQCREHVDAAIDTVVKE